MTAADDGKGDPALFSEVAPGVFQFERRERSGWVLSMFAVRLPSGGLLLHSPTRLGEARFAAVDSLGPVELLLAPNAFHNAGLAAYRARYPDALAVSTRAAMPRLATKGHRGLVAADAPEVTSRLPVGARLLEPAGLSKGETFVFLPGPAGNTLIVCDAFFHVTHPVTGLFGLVSRAFRVVPGLQLGRTFALLAVKDRGAYRAWLEAELPGLGVQRVLFSHGSALQAADATGLLLAVARRVL